ncbi:helix-turn-helix domain-containing protein [Aquisalimonas lutea]|uniref:GlxA family transcriptional regulator n=1 Tax=Aquisalimonas lutea TaxID=1327750 RepID=UPI0025B490FE|nr:helix-turn-helix domain-containing protein [Aquisalimonas lutea]MDN3519128.1 helix-turn-helix domain-containing protein [Aquisalimonas lutea]
MHVGILLYGGCLAMEAFAVSDLLLLANRLVQAGAEGSGEPPFRVEAISVGGRRVSTAGGFSVGASRPPESLDRLIVPGFDFGRFDVLDGKLAERDAEQRLIRRAFRRGTPVASVCTGAFMLAEAGLLDGRRGTTAWLFAPELARRYPSVEVVPEALFIEDTGVTTAGAFSAATDLAISLVRARCGNALADNVAGVALVDGSRDSQAPSINWSMLPAGGYSFSEQVRRWLADRYHEPYDAARLARAFHVSPRTLLRRFRREMGMTPLRYLQGYRVQIAKQLLSATALSVGEITDRVGYADTATFCSLFRRHTRTTPAAYRRRHADAPGSVAHG